MSGPVKFFDQEIEPKPLCGNCEYYNGNGLMPNGEPREMSGDCMNTAAPRFQTSADETCPKFFPCSIRWPDADHG